MLWSWLPGLFEKKKKNEHLALLYIGADLIPTTNNAFLCRDFLYSLNLHALSGGVDFKFYCYWFGAAVVSKYILVKAVVP